jgi:DNA-binding LacI/PurR family transcriptional regulator
MRKRMPRVLIVANRTVAGRKLLDAVRERADEESQFHLVVPLSKPRHGNVIYDDAARDAAQLRVDLAQAYLRQDGIELTGEVGDEDPLTATADALATFPADEIIVSTLPQTRSGWLRRDLIERIQDEIGKPVHHIVTDPEQDGLAVGVTLVVANRTAGGQELVDMLRAEADSDRDRIFIAVVPQEGGEGSASTIARQRLTGFLTKLRENGVMASGMIGDPDPHDAILNALDLFTVDHVVISTLPQTKSGWMRADLVDRVRNATAARVDHVEVALEGAPA